MNMINFWRLAWKEYRQQRDLFWAIALLTVLIYSVVIVWAYLEHRPFPAMALGHVSLLMPCFYALGCGAMLFAGEHERETFTYLRSLPAHSASVFTAKIALGIVSCLVLTGVLCAACAMLTARSEARFAIDSSMAAMYVLAMIIVLTWSTLYSLVLRNPLWAVVASGISFFVTPVLFAMLAGAFGMHGAQRPGDWGAFELSNMLVMAVLPLGVVFVGRGWLDREASFTWIAPSGAAISPIVPTASHARSLRVACGRLLWQWWYESAYRVLATYGVFLLLLAWLSFVEVPLLTAFVFLPSVIGSCTFFNDQWKQSYRFFAEHGVSATEVWSSRIAASALACVPWLIVAMTWLNYSSHSTIGNRQMFGSRQPGEVRPLDFPADFMAAGLVLFALGQFCSIRFRGSILGVFTGVALGVPLLIWMFFLRLFGIPDIVGMLPLAVILLGISWWHAGHWITDRDSWLQTGHNMAIAAMLLVGYLAILAAHRAYEIPDVANLRRQVSGPQGIAIPETIAANHKMGFAALSQPESPEAIATANMYRALGQELRQPLPQPAFGLTPDGAMCSELLLDPVRATTVGETFAAGMPSEPGSQPGAAMIGIASEPDGLATENERALLGAIERFIETSGRNDCDFLPDRLARTLSPQDQQMIVTIQERLFDDAHRLEKLAKHVDARERYFALLRFARHLQLRGTLECIGLAIELESQVFERLVVNAQDVVKSPEELAKLLAMLRASPYAFEPNFDAAWCRNYLAFYSLAELVDSSWQNAVSGGELGYVRNILIYMPWERERSLRLLNYSAIVPQREISDVLYAPQGASMPWHVNTALGNAVFSLIQGPSHRAQTILTTQRAALATRLRIMAWRAEFGHLPDSLAEVDAGSHGPLPLDPNTGAPFLYRRYDESVAEDNDSGTQPIIGCGEAYIASPAAIELVPHVDSFHKPLTDNNVIRVASDAAERVDIALRVYVIPALSPAAASPEQEQDNDQEEALQTPATSPRS